MTIYKKRKHLFLHIPRTGGSTIEVELKDRNNNILFGYHNNTYAKQHLTLKQILEFGYMNENEINDYFIFSFIRNPWDKLKSSYKIYYHKFSNGFQDYLERVYKIVQSFEEKDDYIATDKTWNIKSYEKIGKSEVQFRPQHHYIYHNGNNIINFLGCFENYKTDKEELYNNINIPVQNIVKKINKSTKNFDTLYDKKCIDLVYKIYEKDIELFDYKYK